ncbi:response regulator [Paenibacillus thalictri]|uniref:Response regulator transcription factor n=1 Tax=Paenibacillus thalictri TaxID=2527873 RepID=A0A4Q9DEL0_9BACL|nr:response regulator transcription factor [Paenibacillus thalictri]TBL70054.1 response regulator transcription factor [Paenibacillus thalictri]
MSSKIKVLIVDDHDMVRIGLRTFLSLEAELEVVGEAVNGHEAVQYIERGENLPDVVLMDLMMPVMDGVEATRRLQALRKELKIVLLTSFLEDEKVLAAVEAGATSYVLKTVSSDQLVKVVKSAHQGLPEMNPEVAQALSRGLRQRSVQGADDGITAREREVLLLIAEGKTNQEIADELHIGIKTVKTHVSNLLMKLELADRTQLAIYAHRNGMGGKA